MRPHLPLVAIPVALLLGGCATTPAPGCPGAMQSRVEERLYFGTQRPGGVVSDAEWEQFVEATVVPNFPDGFTTWKAQGAWRGADGVTVREASHVLSVMRPEGAEVDGRVAEVMTAYRAAFEQEAVLRVSAPVCVAF